MEQHTNEEERAPSLRETLLPTLEQFLTNDGERKVGRWRSPKDELTGVNETLYIQDDEGQYRIVDKTTMDALVKKFLVANDATNLWNPGLSRKIARYLLADAQFIGETAVKA